MNPSPSASSGRSAQATILLLEDEPVLRASIARGLGKMEGVDVMAAANFEEALALLAVRAPKLVVSDIDLPDRSGLEMIGELARRGMRAPIIFVTAYLKTYRSRIPSRDDILVLEKPVPLEQLRSRVAERIGPVEEAHVPFSVADYVQLACMGRHSVVIEVEQRGLAAAARVVVFHGELWSALDGEGRGEAAFRRLAFVADDPVRCVALVGEPGARDVHDRFDALVLEAARQHDEAERDRAARGETAAASPAPSGAVSAPRTAVDLDDPWTESTDKIPLVSLADLDAPDSPAPSLRRDSLGLSAERIAETAQRSFDALWEEGVDALLTRNYAAAERAFRAAAALRPDDRRVAANLARLHELGYPRDPEEGL